MWIYRMPEYKQTLNKFYWKLTIKNILHHGIWKIHNPDWSLAIDKATENEFMKAVSKQYECNCVSTWLFMNKYY